MSDVANAEIPFQIRIQLLHAYVQLLADESGVDVLQVKGAAVSPVLAPEGRSSMDVDVLVRPAHVDRLIQALTDRGWTKMTGFEEGSAFGHAMNLRHDLGMVDVHRSWPGFEIDSSDAFERLWQRQATIDIAHVPCVVPDLACQRLILLLHYGRSGGQRPDDLDASWTSATPDQRAEVETLAAQFRAHVALAAATGDLERYRDAPSYRLWKYFRYGSSNRFDEWIGRWQAARTVSGKWRVAKGFVSVNDDLLQLDVGHRPTWRNYRDAYADRVRTAWVSVVGAARRRVRGGPR